MDGHELNGIFGCRKRDAGQIVFIFDHLVDHGNEARQALKAGLSRNHWVRSVKVLEIGLALGPIKDADIVIVIAILLDFSTANHRARGLGSSAPSR